MSIKHRIAIGKIIDGEWKHERYATPEEMEYLSPKYDGSGVMLAKCHRVTEYNSIGQEVNWILVLDGWQDVSDTHRVEWGMETNNKHGNQLDIYNGDIFVDWNTGIECECSKPVVFELFVHHDFVHPESFPMVEILGNLNENAELLEAGK